MLQYGGRNTSWSGIDLLIIRGYQLPDNPASQRPNFQSIYPETYEYFSYEYRFYPRICVVQFKNPLTCQLSQRFSAKSAIVVPP